MANRLTSEPLQTEKGKSHNIADHFPAPWSFQTFIYFPAFSIFAFVEYLVAAANMYYYWTIVCDLPTEDIVVMKPPQLAAICKSSAASKVNGHAGITEGAKVITRAEELTDEDKKKKD